MTVKKIIGALVKLAIAAVVIAFLGLKSLDFFTFVTPADQWYYAYLGFGLTGGGVIAYLIVFLWDADTHLKKATAIIMLAVCVIGELATAGFGLQVNAWQARGFQLTDSDFNSMILVIQLLGFAHAIALIAYVAGDPIGKAFADDDGDGIPNVLDPVDNRTGEKNDGLLSRIWNRRKPVQSTNAREVNPARPGLDVPPHVYDKMKEMFPEYDWVNSKPRPVNRTNQPYPLENKEPSYHPVSMQPSTNPAPVSRQVPKLWYLSVDQNDANTGEATGVSGIGGRHLVSENQVSTARYILSKMYPPDGQFTYSVTKYEKEWLDGFYADRGEKLSVTPLPFDLEDLHDTPAGFPDHKADAVLVSVGHDAAARKNGHKAANP